jgi:hypothetical protein
VWIEPAGEVARESSGEEGGEVRVNFLRGVRRENEAGAPMGEMPGVAAEKKVGVVGVAAVVERLGEAMGEWRDEGAEPRVGECE